MFLPNSNPTTFSCVLHSYGAAGNWEVELGHLLGEGGGHWEDVKLLKGWKDSRLLTEPFTKLLPDGLRCWRIKGVKIKKR